MHGYINPSALTKPTGYTHIVKPANRRTTYISGQIAFDKEGKVVGTGDFRAQTIQVFENLKAALAAVGGSFANVVKVTTFVTDIKNAPILREVRTSYFGANPPASTLI